MERPPLDTPRTRLMEHLRRHPSHHQPHRRTQTPLPLLSISQRQRPPHPLGYRSHLLSPAGLKVQPPHPQSPASPLRPQALAAANRCIPSYRGPGLPPVAAGTGIRRPRRIAPSHHILPRRRHPLPPPLEPHPAGPASPFSRYSASPGVVGVARVRNRPRPIRSAPGRRPRARPPPARGGPPVLLGPVPSASLPRGEGLRLARPQAAALRGRRRLRGRAGPPLSGRLPFGSKIEVVFTRPLGQPGLTIHGLGRPPAVLIVPDGQVNGPLLGPPISLTSEMGPARARRPLCGEFRQTHGPLCRDCPRRPRHTPASLSRSAGGARHRGSASLGKRHSLSSSHSVALALSSRRSRSAATHRAGCRSGKSVPDPRPVRH